MTRIPVHSVDSASEGSRDALRRSTRAGATPS